MYNPTLSRPFVFILATLAIIVLLAVVLAISHQSGLHSGSLMLFDEDLSDSVFGWALAIPILMLTMVLLVVVLTGAGVIVLGALALALVAVLLSVVFAVLLTLLPLAAFLVVPILVVVGLVKFAGNRKQGQMT